MYEHVKNQPNSFILGIHETIEPYDLKTHTNI